MRRPILRNYLTLAATSIGVWGAGLVHRAMVARLGGQQVLGLYQMTFPAYRLLSTVVTAGLPVVLTTLTAGYVSRHQFGEARRARDIAALVVLVLSGAAAIFLWLGRPFLAARFFTDSRVGPSLSFLPITLAFSCEAAVLQSYYQGLNNMKPFALSQVVEQVTRLGLTFFLMSRYQDHALLAAAATAASAAAEVAGFFALLLYPGRRIPRDIGPYEGMAPVLRGMLVLSLPLLVSGLVGAVLQMVNVVVVPRRLFACGYSVAGATKAIGTLFGMAVPLVFFPTVLVFPLTASLLPVISAAASGSRFRETLYPKLRKAYALALALGVAAFFALRLAGPYLARILYGTAASGEYIRLLAFTTPLNYTGIISVTLLSGLKKNYAVLGINFLDSLFETALLYLLTSPRFGGLNGTVTALVVGWYFFAFVSNGTAFLVLKRFGRKKEQVTRMGALDTEAVPAGGP